MEKFEYPVRTDEEGFYNVTQQVRDAVEKSGVQDGVCVIYSPHTTAGITINENADPNVVKDMLFGLKKTFPDRPEYRHMEGNTTAHLKASFMGSSATVLIENGGLVLGTWQGIYFCEFDGPRNRRFYVKVLGSVPQGEARFCREAALGRLSFNGGKPWKSLTALAILANAERARWIPGSGKNPKLY